MKSKSSKTYHRGIPLYKKIGYNNEARICLTHSFINNDITLAAGPFPGIAFYKSIIKHLNTEECSGYDNIIQLCDLFCLETGFTTLEKRILDISTRKGVFPSSRRHFEKALELKDKIEKAMGSTLYSLFPEIPIQDLEDNQKYLNKLEELFTNINFRPLSIGLSTDITLSEEDKSYYVDKLLRDEHEVFFISDEELSNNIKEISSKVDIMYTNNERHSNDLEALGVPCIVVENNKSDNLKVSTWEELYQQVSAKSSNEIYPITDLDKNNHKGLIKK